MVEWSNYLILLMMTKFGFRPSTILKMNLSPAGEALGGPKSTGVLFEDIESISYDKQADRWKLIFSATYRKTENDKGYRKSYTLLSDDYRGGLARMLVAFFAVRGAFELPMHEAMRSGTPESFRIRAEFRPLSIFGDPEEGRAGSSQFSNTRVPLIFRATQVFKWFSDRIGLPADFMTPRSARQNLRPHECGCPHGNCPYNGNPLLHPLLIHEEYLAAFAACVGQVATRRTKREWFVKMAKAMLVVKPYSEEEIETCLEYYFESQYPFGRDSNLRRTLVCAHDVPHSSRITSPDTLVAPPSPTMHDGAEGPPELAPQVAPSGPPEQSDRSVLSNEEEERTPTPAEMQHESIGSFFKKFTGFFR